MRSVALHKASDHLELAVAATNKLTLTNGFKSFERAWSQFLSQVSRIYAKLEQGAKGCSKSEPWFGRRKYERSGDPLLSYLHHARNSDEHGLDFITQRAADSLSVHFPPTPEVTARFEMMIDDQGNMNVRNPSIASPNGGINKVVVHEPRVELVAVRDRGRAYDPPKTHLGRPIIDRSASGLAHLSLAYLRDMLAEAETLPRTE